MFIHNREVKIKMPRRADMEQIRREKEREREREREKEKKKRKRTSMQEIVNTVKQMVKEKKYIEK